VARRIRVRGDNAKILIFSGWRMRCSKPHANGKKAPKTSRNYKNP
jgi:hypothetical protein